MPDTEPSPFLEDKVLWPWQKKKPGRHNKSERNVERKPTPLLIMHRKFQSERATVEKGQTLGADKQPSPATGVRAASDGSSQFSKNRFASKRKGAASPGFPFSPPKADDGGKQRENK